MAWMTLAAKLVPVVVAAITAVERLMTAGKGKEKQDAAVEIVGDLIPLVEASINNDLLNDDDVQDAIRKIIDAVVALQNVIRDVEAQRKG